MKMVKIIFLSLITILCYSPLIFAGDIFKKAEGQWTSVWEKTDGSMMESQTTFDAMGSMIYVPGGRVEFHSVIENGVWEGYWVENHAPESCDTLRGSSKFWGIVKFQFDKAYDNFNGSWNYCGTGKERKWSGKRIGLAGSMNFEEGMVAVSDWVTSNKQLCSKDLNNFLLAIDEYIKGLISSSQVSLTFTVSKFKMRQMYKNNCP